MTSYYTGTILMAVLACVLMCVVIGVSPILPPLKKKQFSKGFIIVIIGAVFEWGAAYLEHANSVIWLHTMVKALEMCAAPLIPLAIMPAISDDRKLLGVMLGGIVINTVMITLSSVFGFIFYIDAANVYHHGSLYFIYIVDYVFQGLCLLVGTIRLQRQYQGRNSWTLYLILVYMILGIALHNFDKTIHVDYIVLAITLAFFYITYVDMIQSTDSLTTLLNRHSYDSMLSQLNERSLLISVDIDYFKQCNDTFGHLFGDDVLRTVAKVLKENVPNSSHVYRTGGDEFCVIVRGIPCDPEQIIEKIHAAMEDARLTISNLPFVSTGYAPYSPGEASIIDTIENADAMMYKFKNLRKKLMAEGKDLSYSDIHKILVSSHLKEDTITASSSGTGKES